MALQGYSPWFAIGAGVFLGMVPLGPLFGFAEAAAPAWVIRWRERVITRHNNQLQQRVGDWFSAWLAISGPRPWESPTARFRVRILGLALIAFWVVGGVAIALWIWACAG